MVTGTANWLFKRYAGYAASSREDLPAGTAVSKHGRAHLKLVLCGHTTRIISDRAVRRLVRMLRCSASALSLRIEQLRADRHHQVCELLQRLAPYGQRVSI